MMTLRTNVGMIPGGILYADPRTPAAPWLDDHTWPEERVREIIKFRLANPNIYPEMEWTEFGFVMEQVVEFNCRRLGYNGNWCLDSTRQTYQPATPPGPRYCSCGEMLAEKLCPTCSGKRIIGYNCPKCGKEYPK